MIPEPTPSVGTLPKGSVPWPSTVILTTAGPTFAAASMTAEDSSMVTGCWPMTCCTEPAPDAAAGRSRAPVLSRISTVPPDARTADRSDAARTVPTPVPPRRCAGAAEVSGATGGATGAAGRPHGDASGSPGANVPAA